MNEDNGGEERLAPVTPLFGSARAGRMTSSARGVDDLDGEPSARHPARGNAVRRAAEAPQGTRLRALHRPEDGAHHDRREAPAVGSAEFVDPAELVDPTELVERATEGLVRKLRARSMSVAEASTFLRGQQLTTAQIDEIVDEFLARKYLDDRILAGHLVLSGHERKGQGRIALARVLSARGIPREIADAALADLPDDDYERAIEFARSKMRSMSRLDDETAKRRLSGQLARRGYSGSLVSQVVRQALQEQSFGGSGSGVRFE